MNTRKLLLVAAVVSLAWSLSCMAQDRGYWRAASATANTITGDISISERKLTIDILAYTIADIRRLEPAEVSAIFDADLEAGGSGTLYRLHVPAGQHFLRKNTLCGSADTEWMATYVEGRRLKVAFFSGEKAPVFTMEALGKSMEACGIFGYAR